MTDPAEPGSDPTPAALSWLRLLVAGTVEVDEEAGRIALTAGWAARTRRRDTVALQPEAAPHVEARLDVTWPAWRSAHEALVAEALPPTVRGWRQLRDRARRAVPRTLPVRLNSHTAAAWLRGDAKAGLGVDERAALSPTVVTHDNLLRLRPHAGLLLQRQGRQLDADTLCAFTHEVVVPERAILDGLRFGGAAPEILLLIENIGVYLDLPLPRTWCAASIPGWNLSMLTTLKRQWPSTPAVLFGDLDPAGMAIATTCQQQWPELVWFVPPWRPALLAVSQAREWPPLPPNAPETIQRLADANRWIEQEQLFHMDGLMRDILAAARAPGHSDRATAAVRRYGTAMARHFNTTGPCRADLHYMQPPEARLPALLPLVEQQLYFVVHAPRQTGKTTAMRAFAERLRHLGYAAMWATFEESQGFPDVEQAEAIWIGAIVRSAALQLPLDQAPPNPAAWLAGTPGTRLHAFLRAWAAAVDAPLVLLIDEADVVSGPALVSLLRQLRAGFMDRGVGHFPSSVALVGMRDLRDYVTSAKGGDPVNPGSPFNIKAESLTLRNFTQGEVAELYAQHTSETGQPFTPDAIARAFELSQGHPFLVNALARLCTTELVLDRSLAVTGSTVDAAKDALILARTTHLDALAHRLKDPRIAPIVQSVLTGEDGWAVPYDSDDFQYACDLGLLRLGDSGAEAANPIYREVLARQLTSNVQTALPGPWWRWARSDGGLDFPALVEAFRQWWRENADVLTVATPEYPEAVAHLAFMAFLQRVVNGGGRITREFAAGRGAIDLLVEYRSERFVIELKRVRERDGLAPQKARGIAQTGRYLDTVGLTEGWLLLFDVRSGMSWEERLYAEDVDIQGKVVHIRGV